MKTPRDPADGKKGMGDLSPASQEKPSSASQIKPSLASQEKSKRKYVKSGKFVGKYGNHQKQRESKLQQQGQADSSKKKRQNAGQLVFRVFFCVEHMQRCLCLFHLKRKLAWLSGCIYEFVTCYDRLKHHAGFCIPATSAKLCGVCCLCLPTST